MANITTPRRGKSFTKSRKSYTSLPDNMRPEGTGIYAHGIELSVDYSGTIPNGFDLIDLSPCKLMVFQGEPYADEEFDKAVLGCMEKIDIFNPKVYGYCPLILFRNKNILKMKNCFLL